MAIVFAPFPFRNLLLLFIRPSLTSSVGIRRSEHPQTYEIVTNEELVVSAVRDFNINLNYSLTPSPYRAVNTLRLGYTNQSVNVV